MKDAFADEVITGDEDARLEYEYRALQYYAERMARSLARATQLRHTLSVLDAARSGRLAYASDEDAGLSQLKTLLAQMRVATDEIATAHERRMAEKLRMAAERAQRRLSVKMEEEAAQFLQVTARDDRAQDEQDQEALIDQDASFTIDMDEAGEPDGENARMPVEESASHGEKGGPHHALTKSVHGKKPTISVNVLDVVVSPPPRQRPSTNGSTNKPTDPIVVRATEWQHLADSQADATGDDAASVRRELLASLASIIQDVDRAYTYPRSRKPRGALPGAVRKAIIAAVKRAMADLLQDGVSIDLVQVVLRLEKAMTAIQHPKLKEITASPRQILQGIIDGWAETLGGMKRRGASVSSENDERAFRCFALALDLQTTADETERGKLIDDALHTLKQSFWPVVLRQEAAVTHDQDVDDKRKKRGVVAWAGRVMLLAAHIVAHAIASHEPLKGDQFRKTIDRICDRHALFPQFFERARSKVAPFAERPTAPLNMPREARRIEQLDTVV